MPNLSLDTAAQADRVRKLGVLTADEMRKLRVMLQKDGFTEAALEPVSWNPLFFFLRECDLRLYSLRLCLNKFLA